MELFIKKYKAVAAILLFCIALTGCGSGSGSYTGGKSRTAKTSVKTTGLVAPGYLVTTLDIIISMPYGVTVECIPGTINPTANVVQLIGTSDPNMTLNALDYVPATPVTPGSLRIVYLKANGFTPSDSLLVQLDIATGFFPVATDFSLTKFDIATMSSDGLNTTPPTPVSNPTFTVEII